MSTAEFFTKGGPVMYVLAICSLCVAAIAIDRYIFYRRAQKGMIPFLSSLPKIIKEPLKTAMDTCTKETNAAGFIASSGLKAAEEKTDVKLAVDTAYASAAMQLRARLNYLSMIVTLSPLLGLLGTISGMIQSFSIFSLQAGQPLAITGGIGEALIATATGLCVAIFALVVHTYFAQKLDKILNDLERAAAIVISSVCSRNEGSADAT